MTSIRASKVVSPTKVISDGVLVFDEVSGNIIEILEDANYETDLTTTGILIPGFIDIHCHGGGGYSFDDTSHAKEAADFHLKHGTTSVLASLVSAPIPTQVELIKKLSPLVSQETIAGIHLEGPFLSTAKCGAQNPAVLVTPDSASVSAILEVSKDNLKMITIAPELENALQAIEVFVKHKVTVALGHSDATSEYALTAVNAGATVVTHLFNAMRTLHHRESGLADVALADNRLYVEVIADGKHVGDLSIALAHKAKGRKFIAVTDAISASGMPDGDYKLGGISVTCSQDKAVISGTNTLAGSTLNMEKVFDRLVNVYDFDLLDASWATATAPAAAVNLDNVGSLEVGKKANFIVWQNGIHSVYKNGNLVHSN